VRPVVRQNCAANQGSWTNRPEARGFFFAPIKNPAEAGLAQHSLKWEDKICHFKSSNPYAKRLESAKKL
jgi:hypothetical protein